MIYTPSACCGEQIRMGVKGESPLCDSGIQIPLPLSGTGEQALSPTGDKTLRGLPLRNEHKHITNLRIYL